MRGRFACPARTTRMEIQHSKNCGGNCPKSGPGYGTPKEAFKSGQREKLLYVTCTRHDPKKPDYLATVDIDPNSRTYCQVIFRTYVPNIGDELHHSGWNSCSSCYTNPAANRTHLVLPSLHSSRIYFVDVSGEHAKQPKLDKIIEPSELLAHGISTPHTAHCLADGSLMISTMGDENLNAKGNFAIVDGGTFKVKGKWTDFDTPFGYDFWYQPRLNVMVSSEWGDPSYIRKGLNPNDVANGKYGFALHVWDWTKRTHLQRIDLGNDAAMPLEVRFLHEPTSSHGFVGCGLGSNIFHFYKSENGIWKADKVHQAPAIKVTGWALPFMPAVVTDILISMDDQYLYASCWLHGIVLQFDISDPHHTKLVGEVKIGGVLRKGSGVKIIGDDGKEKEGEDVQTVKNRVIDGGPQMLQLSLDGKRLYVTTSLYSVWDNQFFPAMLKAGGVMIQVDVDTERGGMKINENFLVDFGSEPDGPALAHEMRYPGGDCTSDIWV